MVAVSITIDEVAAPISADTKRAVISGQAPVWYKATIDGERVQAEALPVYAPRIGRAVKPGRQWAVEERLLMLYPAQTR